MKRIIRTVSLMLACLMICGTQAEARGRNNGSQGQRQTVGTSQRPGNNGQPTRPGNNGQPARPGNNGHGTSTPSRPGNNGNHGGNTPGHNPGNNTRPGNNPGHNPGHNPGNNNRPGNNHPGHNPGNNNRPGNNHPGHNPGNNNRPGNNHGHNYGRPTPPPNAHHGWNNLHWGRPNRPLMPPPRPFYRPTPPPHFRPAVHFPTLSTVLGVAFGTAINLSINSLLYSGYDIAGYGPDAVYLNNVSQLNLNWPFATLYYTSGALSASEFAFSTSYYDTGRYNTAYSRLVNIYGMPYSSTPLGNGGVQVTWWGNGGQFITLSYAPQRADNGSLRYYTTLSFGR